MLKLILAKRKIAKLKRKVRRETTFLDALIFAYLVAIEEGVWGKKYDAFVLALAKLLAGADIIDEAKDEGKPELFKRGRSLIKEALASVDEATRKVLLEGIRKASFGQYLESRSKEWVFRNFYPMLEHKIGVIAGYVAKACYLKCCALKGKPVDERKLNAYYRFASKVAIALQVGYDDVRDLYIDAKYNSFNTYSLLGSVEAMRSFALACLVQAKDTLCHFRRRWLFARLLKKVKKMVLESRPQQF